MSSSKEPFPAYEKQSFTPRLTPETETSFSPHDSSEVVPMSNLANIALPCGSFFCCPVFSAFVFFVFVCSVCCVSETKSKGFALLCVASCNRCPLRSLNACKYLIPMLGSASLLPPSLTAHNLCNFPYYLEKKFSDFIGVRSLQKVCCNCCLLLVHLSEAKKAIFGGYF